MVHVAVTPSLGVWGEEEKQLGGPGSGLTRSAWVSWQRGTEEVGSSLAVVGLIRVRG